MKILTMKLIPSRKTGNPVGAVINDVFVGTNPHILADGIASQVVEKWGDYIQKIEELEPHLTPYCGQSLHGKKLLIWRSGGYGDILFLTPLIRRLKTIYPTSSIRFATQPKYRMVFDGNPDVEKHYPMPMPLSAVKEADFHLYFEGTIEKAKDPTVNAVDLLSSHAGVEIPDENKLPIYNPSSARVKVNRQKIIDDNGLIGDSPWVAIQVRASSPVRTYPVHLLSKVINKLCKSGMVVLVLGMKGDFPKDCRRRGVIDLCGAFIDMTDTVAVLASCKLLVAPDSSLTHFAAAMSIPCVALYGPFPGSARTSYYPLCNTLEAKADCAPCMLHGHFACPEALKRRQLWSPCFDSIQPRTIIEAVRNILT